MKEINGIWRLKSFIQKSKNGDSYFPFGENPDGTLIYDKSGYMSVIISRSDRKDLFIGKNLEELDKSSLLADFIAYSGKYDISDEKVVHQVEMSFIPQWIGKDMDRSYQIENEKLILITPLEDNEFFNEIIWERL